MYRPGQAVHHGAPFRYSGERLTCDVSLLSILREAFSLKDYQIKGPGWLVSETYQINAVMSPGTGKDTARLMLQTMLAQRLGLRYHREEKELPGYVLAVGRGGFKLQPTDAEEAKNRAVDTPTGPQRGIASVQSPGRFAATATSLGGIADWLTHQMDGPVVDRTGISGLYAIDLHWTPDDHTGSGPRVNDSELTAEIERQMGLKLEKRKMPFEILVVDSVHRIPAAN
jgi:uncharacterized protein (TIGR03435 family)